MILRVEDAKKMVCPIKAASLSPIPGADSCAADGCPLWRVAYDMAYEPIHDVGWCGNGGHPVVGIIGTSVHVRVVAQKVAAKEPANDR